MKILVVDDEELLVKGIRFNLMNEGYEIITGSNGLEAVALAQNQKPDLIILDDLGAEIENQFNSSTFYSIINARQNLNKPVIVNTNLTFKEIEQRYSQRTLSRLSIFRTLRFAGTDVRMQKQREQYQF